MTYANMWMKMSWGENSVKLCVQPNLVLINSVIIDTGCTSSVQCIAVYQVRMQGNASYPLIVYYPTIS